MTWFVHRTGEVVSAVARAPQIGWLNEQLADNHAEILAYLNRSPVDLSNIDTLDKVLKAQALLLRDYANALKLEVRGLAVLLVGKGLITAAEAQSLLTYDGSNANDTKTVEDLKTDFAAKYDGLAGG